MASEANGENHTSWIGKAIIVLLCVISMLSVIAYGAVDSWAIGIASAMMAIVAVLWFVDSMWTGTFRYSTNFIQLPLLGLVLLAAIQLLPLGGSEAASGILGTPIASTLSMDPYATRLFIVRALMFLVFLSIALVYIPRESVAKKVTVAIIAFGALMGFYGILQWLAMPPGIYGGLRTPAQATPFGPYVNQHHFAALMELTSGPALALMFSTAVRRDRKLFLALAAGIMGMAIVFTGSRGGLISYVAVITFAALGSFARSTRSRRHEVDEGNSTRNRNLLVIAAAVGMLVLVIGSVSFLGGGSALLRGMGLEQTPSDITSGRSHFWSTGWQIFLANPVIGAGFDAFGVAYSRYDTWNGLFRVEQAHNDYLQILADGGIVGFTCVVAFVYLIIRNGFSAMGRRMGDLNRSIVTGALAGCFGILIHSFFDFPLRTTANAFFFLLLVVLASGIVRSQNERSSR